MELEKLPQYIIHDILNYLSLKKIIEMEEINKKFKQLIISNKWDHLVRIKDESTLIDVFDKYKFTKFDLSYSNITDRHIKMLSNCHTLDLSGCNQITDESVKLLGKCHTLNLIQCQQITDESVKLLGNCHTLYLGDCFRITDESVKLLGNCHTLELSWCNQITDASVKLLGKCHTLNLSGC